MNKSGLRRQKKLAQYLLGLLRHDRRKFVDEWEKRIQSWLHDIHVRADLYRHGSFHEARVFQVLEQANRLLELCGAEVESLVGRATREILVNESCRAFSLSVSTQLYRIYNRKQYLKR